MSPPAERWHRVWPVTSARRAVGQAGDPPAEWQPMMVRDECPHAALHRRVVRGRPRHVDWTDAAIIAATLRERQCDKPVMPWHHEPPWFHGGARRDRVRHDWLADGGRALLPCAAAAYGVAWGEVGGDGGGGGEDHDTARLRRTWAQNVAARHPPWDGSRAGLVTLDAVSMACLP